MPVNHTDPKALPRVAEGEVTALARGLALVRAVAAAQGPLGNAALAEATGIPKATVSRLAATLVGAGCLRQDAASERYSLGATLVQWSTCYLRHFDLRSVARPHLVRLAEQAGIAVHLGVREGADILIIDSVRAQSALILSRLDVGSRMSIATSASGRAWLVAASEEEAAPVLDALREAAGGHWPALQKKLSAARTEHDRLGYCSSFGEWHPQINALGFVLRGPRGELHVVSCGGPAFVLPRQMLAKDIAPLMLAAQAAIAADVGTVVPA